VVLASALARAASPLMLPSSTEEKPGEQAWATWALEVIIRVLAKNSIHCQQIDVSNIFGWFLGMDGMNFGGMGGRGGMYAC